MTIMASVTSMPVQGTRIIHSSFDQVLKSDPVRRLFNQPNIVIHAIPRTDSPTAFKMVSSKDSEIEINGEHLIPDTPEAAAQMKNSPNEKVSNEEENLLPSKSNGKSEILLVPIIRKRKECGHFEPCESLVCDVDIQQYEDDEGTSPLVSYEIDEDEIDATVTEHCTNKKCDALNIDHDRCRRALVYINRCDKSEVCDICKFKFKSKQARVNHKKCRRKGGYKHNVATSTEVFKVRMREKELQILEAARTKKRIDYFDPVKGFKNTMEALTNNDELIIIPKMPPKTSPFTFPINPNFSHCSYNNNVNNNYYNNSLSVNSKYHKPANRRVQSSDVDKELTTEMIQNIIRSCQMSINRNDRTKQIPLKQFKLSEHLNGATVKINDLVSNHDYINFTGLKSKKNSILTNQQHSQTKKSGLPLKNVDFNLPQENGTNLLLKSVDKKSREKLEKRNPYSKGSTNDTNLEEMQQLNCDEWIHPNLSYKVVPIAELKSEPSLLHQTQGVPKFCVVPDTSQVLKNTKKHIIKKKIPKEKLKTAYLSQFMSKKKKKMILPGFGVLNLNKKKAQLPPVQAEKLKIGIESNAEVSNSDQVRPLQTMISEITLDIKKIKGKLVKKQRKGSRKTMIAKRKYKCTICLKKFSSIDYCNLHMAKHKNKFNFFCRLCDKGFMDKYVLKKHIDGDHKENEVRCELCSSILSSVQELSKHMKSSESEVKRDCTECSENFDTCGSLDFHMRKEHGFLICTVCKRQIAKTKINNHLMFEHSVSKNRLDDGIEKLALPPSENDVVCEQDLLEYMVVEPPSKPAPKIEPIVENKVETDCLAKGRSARRRSSKELFTCTVCERRFENEKQYQIHIANFPRKFTTCADCGKKFHRKSDCTEHSKTCGQNTTVPTVSTPKQRKLNESVVKSITESENLESKNDKDKKLNDSVESVIGPKTNLNKEQILETESKYIEREKNKINDENFKLNSCTESCEEKIVKAEDLTDKNDQKLNQCNNNVKTKTVKIVFIKNKLNKEIKIINKDNTTGEILKLSKYNNSEPKKEIVVKIKNENNVELKTIKKDNDVNKMKRIIESEKMNGVIPDSNDCLKMLNVTVSKDNAQKVKDKFIRINTEEISFSTEKETIVKSNDLDTSRVIANIIQDHNYQSINKIED